MLQACACRVKELDVRPSAKNDAGSSPDTERSPSVRRTSPTTPLFQGGRLSETEFCFQARLCLMLFGQSQIKLNHSNILVMGVF